MQSRPAVPNVLSIDEYRDQQHIGPEVDVIFI